MVVYVNDPETTQHWDRVTGKKCTTFKITEKTVTQRTMILRNWILRQTDKKDNQTRN